MHDKNRAIEAKLNRIRNAMAYLREAKQALENDLFDRVPSGRIDAHYNMIAGSIANAIENLQDI